MKLEVNFALLSLLVITLALFQDIFADYGQEITLTLDYSHFLPVSVTEENNNLTRQQVKVRANYTTEESSILNQTINAVMKVYTSNKTLIKTSSFPEGFLANTTDTQQLSTTLTGNALQNVTAVVQFTDAAKTIPLSNPLVVNLTFGSKIEK